MVLIITNLRYVVLNETLTAFYFKAGHLTTPEEWLDKNPYSEASFDDSEDWVNI
jgi:hypothetical protein